MSNIKSFMNERAGPYKKPLKVTVVAVGKKESYRTTEGVQKEMLPVGIADQKNAALLHCYNKSLYMKFTEGKSLVLHNIVKKSDGTVVLTEGSRVFVTTVMDIEDTLKMAAENLLNPPPAPVSPLKEAIGCPLRQRISIAAKVIQEDQPQEVMVKGEPVTIKAIYVQDDSLPKVKVTLWREAANTTIRPGDFCTITDLVTNTFRNESSLNSTSKTTIEKKEMPLENLTTTIVGVSVENQVIVLLNDTGSFYSVSEELLRPILPTDVEIETFFSSCERKLKIGKKGDDVVTVSMQD